MLLAKSLAAKRESRQLEFKESFDVGSRQEWCEIIKDLVAIANSGGGVIVFGVNNRGEPTDADLSPLRRVDPATITDRLHRYTETYLTDFEIHEPEKAGYKLVAWIVRPSATPIVFAEPGTYPVESGKQRTAFGRGTVYFRHGAKSEPGTTEDIADVLERRLESIRREWLSGVRKVVHAPAGSRVAVLPAEISQSDSPESTPIRITEDPAAPAYRVVDPDTTHPYRQKELMAAIRKRLPRPVQFNSFDVVTIRHAHGIDENREFVHKPKFGSRQYSQRFLDWIVDQIQMDPEFLQKARAKYRATDSPSSA